MSTPFSYDWTRFVVRIEIATSPERVFRAWTEAEKVQAWFPEKAETEPKKGGRFYLEFLGGDIADMKFLELRKPSKIAFTFGDKGETVTVRIRKAGKKTICELEQAGMSTSPKSRVNMHMGCKTGWAFFLTNLKAYLEHGIDLRSHDRRKTYNQSYVNS